MHNEHCWKIEVEDFFRFFALGEKVTIIWYVYSTLYMYTFQLLEYQMVWPEKKDKMAMKLNRTRPHSRLRRIGGSSAGLTDQDM